MFVDYLNMKDRNICFTFKIEEQHNFSFLDIKIFRNSEKNSFETPFYRKITFSGVFTNFKCFIPRISKNWIVRD